MLLLSRHTMLAAARVTARRLPAAPRALCMGERPKAWDPLTSVHGRPAAGPSDAEDDEGATIDALPTQSTRGTSSSRWTRPAPRTPQMHSEGAPRETSAGSAESREQAMKFQAYVRQRLAEMELRMPPKPSAREEAELAFLEKEVIEDHMSPKRRALRDPLKDVKIEEITHTNLPLICRFVSEGGSILSPKLTGVSKDKQKALAKAIKRARQVTRAYAQAPRFPPRLQPSTRHVFEPSGRDFPPDHAHWTQRFPSQSSAP